MKEAAELPLGKEWMFVMSLWKVWKSPTTESFVWRAYLMLLTSIDVLFWFEGQNELKPYRSCRCFVRGSTCAWPLDAQGHSWLSTGPTENVRMCLAWLKKTTMSAGARWHPYTIPWHAVPQRLPESEFHMFHMFHCLNLSYRSLHGPRPWCWAPSDSSCQRGAPWLPRIPRFSEMKSDEVCVCVFLWDLWISWWVVFAFYHGCSVSWLSVLHDPCCAWLWLNMR